MILEPILKRACYFKKAFVPAYLLLKKYPPGAADLKNPVMVKRLFHRSDMLSCP